MSPAFTVEERPDLSGGLLALLPRQGSFELQNDQPGKLHSWHSHDLDEELFVMVGEALLFWEENGTLHTRVCPSGTWITLPAGTVHGSIAGPAGAIYMIRPEDGRTAVTTFLAPEQHPHPIPEAFGAV